MSTSERRWRGVKHDVHDTRLTGAMVARTCGAHQGAGATLTCFEASGGLRTANEERGETRDEDEDEVRRWRGSRGEASDDGAARTKASWWRCHHVQQSRSMRGQSAFEGLRCGSWNRIPSSTLGLPLHLYIRLIPSRCQALSLTWFLFQIIQLS